MGDTADSGSWSRRSFLATAMVGAAALAGGCTEGSPSRSTPAADLGGKAPGTVVSGGSARPDEGARRRVVVVGAGLAGLTAALDLRDAGWEVTVLEARDRVGGRVHTLHAPFTDGLHAEGGGESIDDTHDQIQALVRRFGLATERRPTANRLGGLVYEHGHRSSTRAFAAGAGGAVGIEYLSYGATLDRLAAGVDPDHPERAPQAAELDRRSLAAFIEGLHLSEAAALLVRADARGGFNAEPTEVSLLFAVQQAAAMSGVPDSAIEAMRITGGNSSLVEAMAQELGDRVVLGAPVSRIEYTADSVRVVSPAATVDAAHAVLAVPPPPLRRIEFSPAPPAGVASMIAGLELGAAAKVSTQYQRRFWNDLGATGFTITDLPFGVAWAATDSYESAPGILSQFIVGDAARTAATLDDPTRIRTFGEQLDTVYPEGIPLRAGPAATVAWAREPFTGGGYAVYGPGQMIPFWPVLRDGFAAISFAGEHTETLAGYMESAVRSGHRIARQLGAPPPT